MSLKLRMLQDIWTDNRARRGHYCLTMFGTDTSKALVKIDWMIVKVTHLGEGEVVKVIYA